MSIRSFVRKLFMISEQPKDRKRTGRRLFAYLRPYWKYLLFGVVASAIASGLESSLPVAIGVISDVLTGKGQQYVDIIHSLGYKNANAVIVNVFPFYILAAVLISGLFAYFRSYFVSFTGQSVVRNIRSKLYGCIQRLPISFFGRHKVGELVSRTTNDVQVLQEASNSLIDIFHSFTSLIIVLVLMLSRHSFLTLVALVTFPIVAFLVNWLGVKMRKASYAYQSRLSDLTAVLSENLSLIRLIKSFRREKHEQDRFDQTNQLSFKAWMKSIRIVSFMQPITDIANGIALAWVFWFGCYQVMNNVITMGGLFEFIFLMVILYQPIRTLGRVNTIIARALAAAERVFELMDEPAEYEKPDATVLGRVTGEVRLENVSYQYQDNDQPALHNISLIANPSEVVAVVGPSGAGKTTLVSLIPRFFDPQTGSVLIDGTDIRDVKFESLRGQIGIVPQESVLFAVSIAENVRYGRLEATKEEVEEACRAANAHDFILNLPKGYDTVVGERGATLSGGERQRVAIARAILSDPRILILDEATSSLDTQSERLIQEAMQRLMQGRTTFVIAHRLSTVRYANKIAVMDKGKLVELGTHDELLAKKGLYSKLCKAQFIAE